MTLHSLIYMRTYQISDFIKLQSQWNAKWSKMWYVAKGSIVSYLFFFLVYVNILQNVPSICINKQYTFIGHRSVAMTVI